MDGGGDEAPATAGGGPKKIAEGPWAGWWSWSDGDPFEMHNGPFYSRVIDGSPVCAFIAEPKHMNGLRGMHGGCMLTFADFALFALSTRAREGGPGVTVSLNAEFLGPASVGERIEARGEVTRAGKGLVFVRGLLTAEGRPMLSFSGVIKRVKRRD